MSIEPEIIELKHTSVFTEKEVKGKVIDETPLARSLMPITDNSLIGQERNKIIQWEKSIENLKLKINERKSQIRDAKKRIKLYEKAAALK